MTFLAAYLQSFGSWCRSHWRLFEDHELLPLVLEQLQDIQDLISCASVSKSFYQACRHIRPAAIVAQPVCMPLPKSQTTMRNCGSLAVQTRLTQLSQQGCLQNLKSVTLSTPNVPMLKAISFCPLQRCKLDSLNASEFWVIEHLPITITHLSISGVVPAGLCLSRFARLVSLVSLHVITQAQHTASLVIDCHVTQLQTLSLSSVYGAAYIDYDTCSNIPSYLPNLRYLKVCESAFSFSLYTLLNLSNLHELELVLRARNSEGYAPVRLILERPSQLRKLSISGPYSLVTLIIRSQAVEVFTNSVNVINMV